MRTVIAVPTLLRWYHVVRNRVVLNRMSHKVKEITQSADRLRDRSDAELADDYQSLKHLVEQGATPEQLEVDLFALICEQAYRTLGMRPYDVQLLAALLLRRNKIIQMETGEGKTLVAPFHAIIDVLFRHRVTIVAPNDYLSYRDARWMGSLYNAFGVSVSAIQPGDNPHEKLAKYQADVVYVSTATLVFDWLRAQHALTAASSLPIIRDTIIIDEVDAVLLDQATSSYDLSHPIAFQPGPFAIAEELVQQFSPGEDFEARPKVRTLELTSSGFAKVDRLSASVGLVPADGLFYLRAALAAHHLFQRDRDYIVEHEGTVPLEVYSGRPLHGSKFDFGIQQAIDQKEGLPLSHPNTTLNKITLQSFFSSFRTISGMSGSAIYNALEFKHIYGLDVIPVPPHRRCVRVDRPDVFYGTKTAQLRAVANEIEETVKSGRPVLVGATNIQDAEVIGGLCTRRGVDNHILSAKNHFVEAEVVKGAGQEGCVTIVAQMAGRGVDIRLDPRARDVGGLHVIGVGRSEARRSDEQLIGRSGRQGDPGSSQFILSLMDDLMVSLGSDAVRNLTSKLMGDSDDAMIRARVLSRSIKSAQRQLVELRFRQRLTALWFDRYVNACRETVFGRRAELFAAESYHAEIDSLIARYLERLGHVEPEDLDDRLADIGRLFSMHVPLGVHAAGERGGWKQELAKTMQRTYQERRAWAEPYAGARERLVFLRSTDFCWSLFLDRTSMDFDNLLALFSGSSGAELDRELRQQFVGVADRLDADIDETTLRYLMHLHDPTTLRNIKYWRGLGLRYGPSEVDDPEDGLGTSPDDLMIFPGVDMESAIAPRRELTPHAHQDGHLRQRWPELTNAYLAHLREHGLSHRQLRRVGEVIDEFLRADEESRFLTAPMAALRDYLADLRDKKLGALIRHRRRRIILQFLRYLNRQGVLPRQATVSPGRFALDRAMDAITTVLRPAILLPIAWAAAAFVAYRWLSTRPIPGELTSLVNGKTPVAFPHPALAYQLVDQLLFAGAIQAVTLGLIGAVPLILTDLLFARFGKQNGSLAVYVPLALLLSITAGVWLVSPDRAGRSWDWPALGAIAGLLFLVSCS
jgi:preprotein translocase subunit SecA